MTLELFVDPSTELVRAATFSETGLYRYTLSRTWEPAKPRMAWIMLNPSTADAEVDDPTIRRCIGFAKREGCGGIEVLNLYALRATTPKELRGHPDPEGPDNPLAWAETLYDPAPAVVVAAWGMTAASLRLPPSEALRGYCGPPMRCLGTTRDGFPRHPSRLKAAQPLEVWT